MDTFQNYASSLESPARSAAAIIPSDSTALTHVTRALYVGMGGDIAVEMADGSTATFLGTQGGTILPVRAARIMASGTTAGGLVGLW